MIDRKRDARVWVVQRERYETREDRRRRIAAGSGRQLLNKACGAGKTAGNTDETIEMCEVGARLWRVRRKGASKMIAVAGGRRASGGCV